MGLDWLWQLWLPLAKLDLGQRGELAAERYLRRQGCRIVARRWRHAVGELDLVAVDGRTVVFVEVKTRTGLAMGEPAAAVDRTRQSRLTRAALVFLKQHRLLGQPTRFDVIAVLWPPGQRVPRLDHIRSAHPAVGHDSMFS